MMLSTNNNNNHFDQDNQDDEATNPIQVLMRVRIPGFMTKTDIRTMLNRVCINEIHSFRMEDSSVDDTCSVVVYMKCYETDWLSLLLDTWNNCIKYRGLHHVKCELIATD
jgi:hypothetical protein